MNFMHASRPLLLAVALSLCAPNAHAQPATASAAAKATPADAAAGLDKLRARLKESYANGDVNAILPYLHPDVIIIFPDGELVEGRENLVKYVDRMLKGPDAIVDRYTNAPEVLHRELLDDVAVSHGLMHDHYVLKDGRGEFDLGSRFTVTAVKIADGPADSDGWVVRTFHQSTNAFNNPVTQLVMRKGITYGSAAGLVVGLAIGIVGSLVMRHVSRRRRTLAAK